MPCSIKVLTFYDRSTDFKKMKKKKRKRIKKKKDTKKEGILIFVIFKKEKRIRIIIQMISKETKRFLICALKVLLILCKEKVLTGPTLSRKSYNSLQTNQSLLKQK